MLTIVELWDVPQPDGCPIICCWRTLVNTACKKDLTLPARVRLSQIVSYSKKVVTADEYHFQIEASVSCCLHKRFSAVYKLTVVKLFGLYKALFDA